MGECCDNCIARQQRAQGVDVTMSPIGAAAGSSPRLGVAQSSETPARTPNAHNKRPMVPSSQVAPEPIKRTRGTIPEKRTDEWLAATRKGLQEWRRDLKETTYVHSILTADALLPDAVLTKLATKARIQTLDDIKGEVGMSWALAKTYGEEVLAMLKEIDNKRNAEKNAKKLAKRADKKAKQTEEKAERQRQDAEERELRKAEEKQRADEAAKQETERRAEQQNKLAEDYRRQCERDTHRQGQLQNFIVNRPTHAITRSRPLQSSGAYNQSVAMLATLHSPPFNQTSRILCECCTR